LWEQGVPREDVGGCWVGEAAVLRITTPYIPRKFTVARWSFGF
jgi:hypothetical protein